MIWKVHGSHKKETNKHAFTVIMIDLLACHQTEI